MPDEGDEPNDMARLAADMVGQDLKTRRDRLLCKVLSRGVPLGRALAWSPCQLRVDGAANLHMAMGDRRYLLCALDNYDLRDFREVVRAIDHLAGPLFAKISPDGSYGDLPMDRGDVKALLARRNAAPMTI